MFRIHFTSSDLARTRIVASYGPYAEALFGLGLLVGRRETPLCSADGDNGSPACLATGPACSSG